MKKPLRVLIVEDSELDALMLLAVLRRGGYEPASLRVETAEALKKALQQQTWDVVLADYNLPQFSAPAALETVHQAGIDLPFLIVSGAIGEETAVEAMKAGAHDYLMKGNLARLVPAVERELRESANRTAKRKAHDALRESELRYRLLWENATDAILLMDADSSILFANPAVEKVFGYSASELIGEKFEIFQPEPLRGWFQERIRRFLSSSQPQLNLGVTEMLALRKDQSEIPVEVVFNYLELEGKKAFVSFFRDISERKRAQRELRQNREQFRIARDIQQHLFPKASPHLAGLDVAGASQPAEATGGDYFDYLPLLNNRLGLVVGDVTGHGLGPALLMAETRAYLRLLAKNFQDLGEILTCANAVLAEDVGMERFVTLVVASFDPASRTLTYANAGHPSGYVLGADGQIRHELKRCGVPLGIRPDSKYKASPAIPLETGDMLVLLTDGFEETVSDKDSFFGIERTLDVVRYHRHEPAGKIVAALYKAVAEFAEETPQADDLTVIIAKIVEPY